MTSSVSALSCSVMKLFVCENLMSPYNARLVQTLCSLVYRTRPSHYRCSALSTLLRGWSTVFGDAPPHGRHCRVALATDPLPDTVQDESAGSPGTERPVTKLRCRAASACHRTFRKTLKSAVSCSSYEQQ